MKNHWLERLREQDPRAALRPEISNSELSWLALRLYRAMKRQTLSPLLVEGIVLELLAEAGRVAPARERGSPPWMARMLELLHDEFWRPWTLAAVAQEIGVHPVYLSRAFRRVHRQTLGEYLHRVRVQFAIEHLADESAGLVDVALRAGFADQSHFCRVFKLLTGCSPGAYRKLLRVAGTPS